MTHLVGWQDAIIDCAERFSKQQEVVFVEEIARCEGFMPRGDKDARKFTLECFLDYLVGGSVALAATYASFEPQFEDAFVDIVRDKFNRIREMQKEEKTNVRDDGPSK